MSDFRSTGIPPLNREKYPQDRFDQRLLKHYKNWVRLGKPEDIMEDLFTAAVTPTKGKLPVPEITIHLLKIIIIQNVLQAHRCNCKALHC